MDFWRTGVSYPKKAFSRVWTLERVRADRAGGQCLRLRVDAHPPHEQGAGRAGGQCLRLRVDAHPPHEQGAGVLRFVPVEVGVRVDGGRLRSRSPPPAKACVERRCLAPQGQGTLPVCGGDAVCPCGAKALQSGAPDFGWFAGESCLRSGLPFKNGLAGAPERRSMLFCVP